MIGSEVAGGLAGTATLAALTLCGAVPVALVGIWLARRSRSASVGRQALLVALVPVVATWVGAALAARAMFLSAHDLTAFVTIALTAAVVGVGASCELSRRVRSDARRLGQLSRDIAKGVVPESAPAAAVGELAVVGDQLTEMSRRLDEAHRRELALERSRRELVAWVSHDLRSPLAAVRAMAEALEDGVVDEPADVRRYLRAIGVEVDRLTLLVDDLFELSRITSGVLALRTESVGLGELVAEAVDAASSASGGRTVRLESDVDGAERVRVSPAEASRVLRNLLDNAVRHTPEGGTVLTAVAIDGDEAVISVIDECGGIPADDLDRVFDVAFRGDAARRRDSAGGGLGLTIAKGLVEAQDGRIDVSNRPGGCCFTVRLPLAAGEGR